MSRKLEIKTGDKYSKLTILKEVESVWKHRYFECKCDCWNIVISTLNNLRRLHTKSCWCLAKQLKINKFTTHWMRSTRIYSIWTNINSRCNNTNNNIYKNYWWRWIRCEWKTFEEFYEDMKDWYSDELTIDRTDNNWNYCKENCRWATHKEQAGNRRSNILYKWFTIKHWSEKLWINYSTIQDRRRNWWSLEKAIFTPPRKIRVSHQ